MTSKYLKRPEDYIYNNLFHKPMYDTYNKLNINPNNCSKYHRITLTGGLWNKINKDMHNKKDFFFSLSIAFLIFAFFTQYSAIISATSIIIYSELCAAHNRMLQDYIHTGR